MDELAPDERIGPREKLITFVQDRPGHDLRYAIDASQDARASSAGRRRRPSRAGLRKTIAWFLENRGWWTRIRSGLYRGERLGVVA